MKRRGNRSPFWIAILLAAVALSFVQRAKSATSESTSAIVQPVELIEVNGPINPASADFIADSIKRVSAQNMGALVIELDTPGGLLSSAQAIVKSMLNSSIPVIVYVAPSGASAASAGTFVTVAANIAAMAPGTTIGAAHPIEMGGEEAKGTVAKKIENFTATFAQSIAHERGRNETWIEDAVRKSSTISEREALKLHVIDVIAPDLRSLLVQVSGREVKVAGGRTVKLATADAAIIQSHMRLGESILNRLADPNIMYILMIAGMLGLYFEFAHPGVYLPGVAGAICLLLALTSFQVIPINLAGLLLILLGALLLLSELFVTSYGVLGMGGVIAFVLGSLFLVDTSETNLEINRGIIAGSAIAFSAIVLSVGYIVVRGRLSRAQTGVEGLVGEIGEVREAIAPGAIGRVFVHGEIWRAVSESTLEAGTRARVTAVRGLEIVVQPVSAAEL